jgi:hypothetical protein
MPTTKQACAYLLIATLGFAALACGDDDDSASDTGSSGKGGSSSGSGGKGGSTSAGKGGSTSSAGSGANSTGSLTGADALAGACDMGMGSTATDMCTGIDEFTKCAQDSCKLDDCYQTGSCKTYADCVNKASDPCNSGCGNPPSDCSSCVATAGMCAVNMCFSKIQCGTLTPGGPCDKLDDCCATLDANMKSLCTMTASTVKVGGDMACSQLLSAFCPSMM